MKEAGVKGTVLGRIADSVAERLLIRKTELSMRTLERMSRHARKPHAFENEFRRGGVRIIAEVKFRSPALGELAQGGDAAQAIRIAGEYLEGGAAALSILTEETYFRGSQSYLHAIREAFPEARLLMKDFILDEYQVLEAKIRGADALLLIMALLGEQRCAELLAYARGLGLSALVEVHDEDEFRSAERIGASLIGVNNRDLRTLAISLRTSHSLARLHSGRGSLISESGIRNSDDIQSLARIGYSGFLIGTTLMTAGDPRETLRTLIREGT